MVSSLLQKHVHKRGPFEMLNHSVGTMANRNRSAGRPKLSTHELLDIKGLHLEWDSSEKIRDRLRDGGELLEGSTGEDIPTCVKNEEVLQPLVTKMSLTTTRPLPAVESLRDEVESVYLKNKRGTVPEDMPNVVTLSWRIRKLLGFIKMKVRRREVSSVTFLHLPLNFDSINIAKFTRTHHTCGLQI